MEVKEKEFIKVDEEIIEDLLKSYALLEAYYNEPELSVSRIVALKYIGKAVIALRNIPGEELP